jgi:SAM-dependent methyltransferase
VSDGVPAPYDAAYYAAREGWGDRHIESREAVRRLCARAGTVVLDIGCGSGPLFPLLHGQGLIPVGVETNLTAARTAAQRGLGAVVLVTPAAALPFRAEVAGGVIAQHLLEHVAEPLAVVEEWRRLLRPGGAVVVLTPNGRHPDGAIFADPDHQTLFTAQSLTRLLTEAGFDHVRVTAIFPFLGRGRVGRALSRRLWRAGQAPLMRTWARSLLAVALKAP